jgi:hypothetical protein
MGNSILQKWKKSFKDKREIAVKYFTILAAFNDIHLTEKEVELLAHTAIKGITSQSSRKEFVDYYNTTPPVLNNLISKLYKKQMLVKIEGKVKLNPKINIDFSTIDNIVFNIICLYDNTRED